MEMLICLSGNDAVSQKGCLLLQDGADDSALPTFAITQHGSRLSVTPGRYCRPIGLPCTHDLHLLAGLQPPHAQTSKDRTFQCQLLNVNQLICISCRADLVNPHASMAGM